MVGESLHVSGLKETFNKWNIRRSTWLPVCLNCSFSSLSNALSHLLSTFLKTKCRMNRLLNNSSVKDCWASTLSMVNGFGSSVIWNSALYCTKYCTITYSEEHQITFRSSSCSQRLFWSKLKVSLFPAYNNQEWSVLVFLLFNNSSLKRRWKERFYHLSQIVLWNILQVVLQETSRMYRKVSCKLYSKIIRTSVRRHIWNCKTYVKH